MGHNVKTSDGPGKDHCHICKLTLGMDEIFEKRGAKSKRKTY